MTVMAWQPGEAELGQLSRCLKDSLSGQDKNARKQAEVMLAQARSSPDINNYLTYIFSTSEAPSTLNYSNEEYHAIRSAAAMLLKNNIRSGYKTIPQNCLALIRSLVPLGLQDKNAQIRGYAGSVITEVVTKGGILGWPQLLPDLLALIGNEGGNVTPETQDGAMAALAKICEDNREKLDKDYQGQRPLAFIIPKLIEFTNNSNPKIRSLALSSVNIFISQKPQALLVSLDALLARLFELAGDPVANVRRQVCRAFVQIVEIRPDKLEPHIGGLVDYMLAQQRKVEEEELALDAAEFWLTVGEHENLWQSLGPYLDKIIPVLLESMVYSDEDISMLEGGANDADEDDRVEDIKPQFAKSKTARSTGEGGEGAQNGGYARISMPDDDLDEGEIEEIGEVDDDENPEESWNLRKCSAAALDVFATEFQGAVFKLILPYLLNNLRHEEWQYREAAVLALGAVAEGCMDVVTPHLPELIPYLITLLDDPEPLVRIITCWTLGRYSAWGAGLVDPTARAHFFEPVMGGILKKMLDSNKRVQEAGASAFAHLEEKAKAQLTPYCEPIIHQFVMCFERYKDRNMFILYDCVQTLAEHVGAGLARPDLVNMLMPALIHRWRKVSDQSQELFPLLECLSYVATALGDDFAAFAPPIFTRCIRIIHQNLEEYMVAVNNPNLETPDKDFLVTSLDLLSAVIQALEIEKSVELVSKSNPGFFELLTFCMEDPVNGVRQSSYALLGDCAKYVYPQLQIYLPNIMPVLIKQLDLSSIGDKDGETDFSVVNNACWSAGEIAIQNGRGMAPYVPELFQRLLAIIDTHQVPKSVYENAAIALGRLGLENHEVLAPHLAAFAGPFLKSMSTVDYTEEKASAFKGFTMTVGQNPQAMEKDLVHFFNAIARDCSSDVHYKSNLQPKTQLSEDLHALFQQALDAYKKLIPDFDGFLSQLPPTEQQWLRSTYNL